MKSVIYKIDKNMKSSTLKNVIALLVIGTIFHSCYAKNEKLNTTIGGNDTIVKKTTVEFVPEGKKIYLLDVSGSMQGKGSVQTSDLFDSVKEDIAESFSKISDSCEIVIIPFTSMPLASKRFYSFDEESKLSVLDKLSIVDGNTNIYSAFNRALKEFDSTKNNIVFFITDGYHNEYVSEEVLYELLNSFPSMKEAKYSYLYYYLISPSYRNMEICRIFEENEKMEVIESLIFSKEKCDTVIISKSTIVDENRFEFPLWLLWILLAIFIAILIIYLLYSRTRINKLQKRNKLKYNSVNSITKEIMNNNVNSNVELVGDEALGFLKNNDSDMEKLVKKISSTKGPLFTKDNLKRTPLKDSEYKLEFKGTTSSIIVDKNGDIRGNSGGTKDNGQLNEFINSDSHLKNRTYIVNDCQLHKTDNEGRVVYCEANRNKMYNSPIKISPQRHTSTQEIARENLEGYDGGHIFANSTNGCNNTINQIPMPKESNRSGDWKKLEEKEGKWIKEGKNLITKRYITYKNSGSKVPQSIKTINIVDGKEYVDVIYF